MQKDRLKKWIKDQDTYDRDEKAVLGSSVDALNAKIKETEPLATLATPARLNAVASSVHGNEQYVLSAVSKKPTVVASKTNIAKVLSSIQNGKGVTRLKQKEKKANYNQEIAFKHASQKHKSSKRKASTPTKRKRKAGDVATRINKRKRPKRKHNR